MATNEEKTVKTCKKCGVERSTSEFYKHKETADKLWHSCKSCTKKYNAARYKKNRDKILRQTAEWAANNKDKRSAQSRARRERPGFREREYELRKKWAQKNAHKVRESVGRYRGRKRNQTPEMNRAELVEAQEMYLYHQIFNAVMPEKEWHVDHIQPLAAGGLHHPSNLQVMYGPENQSKGATWG